MRHIEENTVRYIKLFEAAADSVIGANTNGRVFEDDAIDLLQVFHTDGAHFLSRLIKTCHALESTGVYGWRGR